MDPATAKAIPSFHNSMPFTEGGYCFCHLPWRTLGFEIHPTWVRERSGVA